MNAGAAQIARRASRICALLVAMTAVPETPAEPSWTRWAGPNGDFTAPAHGLADSWPEGGPRQLWSRPLGPGQSAILYEKERLYTIVLTGGKETVVCLDARSGETIWRQPYESPPYEKQKGYGVGPRATPLLSGGLLLSIGITGEMLALTAKDGRLRWRRNLLGDDFGGTDLSHGYASSPAAFENLVIVLVGGEKGAVVALDSQSGRVVWRAHDFRNSYSSPAIVEIAGQVQVLAFMAEELVGLDPKSGDLLWRHAHANQWKSNISQPLVADGNLVLLSSLQLGARGLRVEKTDGRFRVTELWSTRRMQLYHGSAVLQGDRVIGSSGASTPAFMSALDIRTGEIAWRKRGFAKANVIAADGRLIILDEQGVLYLATATPRDLVVRGRAQILEQPAWTPPTVVGDRLFARDQSRIVALHLGPVSGQQLGDATSTSFPSPARRWGSRPDLRPGL